MNEFDLIKNFFRDRAHTMNSNNIFYQHRAVGIGDDAAIFSPPDGYDLVVSSDLLLEGTHFKNTHPSDTVGHKVLAVNLSDLAAMGAEPLCFTLSMNLNEFNPEWLKGFCNGLFTLANSTNCKLIGGDTVKSLKNAPIFFGVTILGIIPKGKSLKRDSAQLNDDLWISGALGNPSEAVKKNLICKKLLTPQPRLELGRKLLNIANSAIDISDGLSSDLIHLINESSKQLDRRIYAVVDLQSISSCFDSTLLSYYVNDHLSFSECCNLAVASGDEYELCFSAPEKFRSKIKSLSKEINLPLTRIGKVLSEKDIYKIYSNQFGNPIIWLDKNKNPINEDNFSPKGFSHY